MPKARRTDPQTSHEAAASMRRAATAQAATVLGALKRLRKAGAEQISELCNLPAYTVRKRLPELFEAGLAEPTGNTRKTLSGRSERVWRVGGYMS
jgi:DNA-binding IclR family transcriptional regulator